MYYDIDWLFNEASETAMEDGKRLYYDTVGGSLSQQSLEGKTCFCCGNDTSATFRLKRGADDCYKVSLVFDEQGGLYEYTCDCEDFDEARGPCCHVIAAALKLSETQSSHPSGSVNLPILKASDLVAMSIIKEYTKKRNTRYMASDDRVEIDPTFCIKENASPYIRLKIGRTRRYNIKNISEFLTAVMSSSTARYGAGLKFRHNEGSFSAEAAKFLNFLIKGRKDREEMGATICDARDEQSLTFAERDAFFELYLGKRIAFSQNNSNLGDRVVVEDESFRPSVKISRAEGGYCIEIAGDANAQILIEGRDFCYYINEHYIIRCGYQLYENIAPLFEVLKKGVLFVSDMDMPLFYNNVLKRASQSLDISASDINLEGFSSPPLSAVLYLDSAPRENEGVNDYGAISAELKTSYGDVEVDILSDGYGTQIYRDWESENLLKAQLIEYFPFYPSLRLEEDSDIYTLLKEGIGQLYNYADIFIAKSLAPVKIKKSPRVSVGIRLNSGLLELDFSSSEFSDKELGDLATAYNSGKKYLRLSDGSFIDINDETTGALSSILSLGKSKGNKLILPAFYAQTVSEKLNEGFACITADESFTCMMNDFDTYKEQKHDFGALNNVLREYQKEGINWLKILKNYGFGGILADDMGLGKTLQMLALISDHAKGVSIIVCPTSLIINWAHEAASFTPHLRTLQVMGTAKERSELISTIKNVKIPGESAKNPNENENNAANQNFEYGNNQENNYDIIITSYELFKRDQDLYKDINFEIAVLDEAQYIKNHETQNARSVKKLAAKYRFALTGTPIENSLSELWSIFDYLMPNYLFSYSKFRTKFEAGIVKGSSDNARALKKMVYPFILRRLKSNVLKELPPKVESEVKIPLCDKQKEIYSKHLALIKMAIESGEAKDRITVLSMLTRLRQICCDPSLVDATYEGNSEKLESCINILKNASASGSKVLLFSQYTSMLDIIAKNLDKDNIRYYVLEGSTPKTLRSRLVDKFNSDDTPVFLISLRAGGTGLNLTGADTVIHYDPWWNDPVMNQATDRAHRMGQTKSVNVYKLIIKDSIEEKILALRQKKSALAGLFVDNENDLPISELMKLLIE